MHQITNINQAILTTPSFEVSSKTSNEYGATMMSANITPFFFEGFPVRTIEIDGEPWFVAADMCAVLDLGNVTMALKRLDADEQALISIEGISRGNDQASVINESGLYSLILGSRKPNARKFKRWVTGEVLPAIRKTGRYGTQAAPAELSRMDILNLAIESEKGRLAAVAQLAIAAPKAAFVDAYVDSTGLKGFREVAKLLKANEARLREFLSDKKIMYRLGGEWVAYQPHIDAGRFAVKAGTSQVNGHAFNRSLFTPKGIEWLAGLWAVHCLDSEVAA